MLRILREWRDRARILSDERRLQRKRDYGARRIVDERIQAGKLALESGHREAAVRLWEEARTQYPGLTMESRTGLRLLVDLGRLDDAEELMREGCGRQPRNPFFLEGAAFVAGLRGDHEVAARHWATLRKKFPRVLEGYTAGAAALIRLGRLDEADRVYGRIAGSGAGLFFLIEHASLATTRGDWSVALKRWTNIWNVSGHQSAELGMARCYRETGQLDEAERIVTNALENPLPRANALELRAELAHIAERREIWDEAARRWNDVRMTAPSTLDAYCRGAFALGKCGRQAEAESLLYQAIQRFPSDAQPWVDYARIAEGSGSTDEAVARWQQVHTRFPDYAKAS